MKKYIYNMFCMLLALTACDNANDLLNGYIEDGPIVYAGKIHEMDTQSGYYRYRVNVYPAPDVNRSHCMLRWSISSAEKDSVRLDYKPENYDEKLGCYYTIINLPETEGNLFVEAQNVDVFGNRSLITDQGAFIYGESYVSTLLNAQANYDAESGELVFEERVGSVGNLVSYEQTNGAFTQEEFVKETRYPLVDAKPGGMVRSKTRYLMSETDIDTLTTAQYLETVLPQ